MFTFFESRTVLSKQFSANCSSAKCLVKQLITHPKFPGDHLSGKPRNGNEFGFEGNVRQVFRKKCLLLTF